MDLQDQKEYLFSRVKELISDHQILEFTLHALQRAPDYIWMINGSTSGENHKGETQTEHVLQALKIAEHITEIMSHEVMKNYVDEQEKSLLIAIVVLHDLFKCGVPGRENMIDGRHRTDRFHPLYTAEMLKNIQVWDKLKKDFVKVSTTSWWRRFAQGVTGHSGPWTPEPVHLGFLADFRNLTLMGFLCDYLASRKGINIEI